MRRAILNRIGDEIRRAQMREAKEDFVRDELRRPPSPLEQAIGRETIERYERALATLDPDAQEAVIARIELGLSYAEIAESVGKPRRRGTHDREPRHPSARRSDAGDAR
jgi:RNA polymerase sigma-70 factor (ECF subfamily)